ncbi:hypothetical protein QN277_019299 [Acacia crassicarpa]|uniref:TF-B3 domain-containing protein n=1 Tax=Acacia crassicarpa TaxID=499986 RepID=A0AAE1MSE0_9FABA|nr:hypothetical protein QN277_019297 [Acacia crassicarpa]KAK4276339.1 hypothetical protein QN277_019298 [Acacia crassicarpa]KAK4276340.1 hypothetical protein QN277_019299 [Acacia crassicarpa]
MDDPWGVSCSLKLYDNPWKVQKVLTNYDTSYNNRLILSIKDVTEMVLPVLGENAERKAQTADGVKLWFWDVDTESSHELALKQESDGGYVITGNWNQEFIKRKNLKPGDEIGLQWDRYNGRFNFRLWVKN